MGERRFSRQRERIYQAVRDSRAHPTAQMVYEELREQMPRLSLGTVYRNLHLLAEEGALVELGGPVARFDAQLQPHTHLRCIRCGCVADAELAYDGSLDIQAARQGWRVESHSLIFNGICPKCGKESENMKGDSITWN